MKREKQWLLNSFALLLGLAAIVWLSLTASAQGTDSAGVELAEMSAHLRGELETSPTTVSFLIVLEDQLGGERLAHATDDGVTATRTERLALTYAMLTDHASRTQASLRAWLDARGIPYRPFYAVNMIEVTGDLALAEALRRRPEIDRLVSNPRIDQAQLAGMLAPKRRPSPTWLEILEAPAMDARLQSLDLPYGLRYTHAVELWDLGYTGQGIVVASQDTGVEWDHPALLSSYRGWDSDSQTSSHPYNWYDAWGSDGRPSRCESDAQIPCDDHGAGHGTHTVGTMIGSATENEVAVGMAPDAEWIGCRNMLLTAGTPASYTACFEFFLAPYPQEGDPFVDGRPELAPHVINNSWKCPPSEGCDADTLRQIVEVVRAAGIFVVAGAGNYGDACSTVRDPIAIYAATFSVGAHDDRGHIAGYSSRGPVSIDGSGRLKPDISAPGSSVFSSTVNGDYSLLSGTSMASPHVAGAAALLWSALPDLIGQIERTEQALIKGATPVPVADCSGSDIALSPNYVYGYGTLNALASVELARHPANLLLRLVDSEGGPESGLIVILTDTLTGYAVQSLTSWEGEAYFPWLLAGTYQLTVEDESSLLVDTTLDVEADGSYAKTYPVESICELETYPQPNCDRSYVPFMANE